jgi:hypothetical protein
LDTNGSTAFSPWLIWVFGRNQYSPWNAGNAVPLFGCGLWLR